MFLHHVPPFLRERIWRTTVLTIRVHSQEHHRLTLRVKIIKVLLMLHLNQVKLIFRDTWRAHSPIIYYLCTTVKTSTEDFQDGDTG